ncbi:hypothetical protein GM415_16020 [Pseudodesulfovibrio cashew]|uniref:Uncharacterized protein n=1 Tax=Pseudodesulfovibrio cashew TaxID=2678688 RepID=A0A6I6JNA1_9BACT|nr:hypothetical protein [Pseudodesulfovibrio cashew]QGY41563.1 hypothetical protein GM415_16020 [Pseudodesulfovibrio cashew]
MADARLTGHSGYFNPQDVRLNVSRDSESYDPIGELFDIAGGLTFLAEKFDTDSEYGPARILALLASNVRGVAFHMDDVESAASREERREDGERELSEMPLSENEFKDVLNAYCEQPEAWRKIAMLYGMGGKDREMLKRYVEEAIQSQEAE